MKISIKFKLLLALSALIGGCANVSNADGGTAHNRYQSSSSSSIKESIAYMYEEERLAHDLYLAIYNRQPVTQLQRIATRSEVRHIDAVASLANKYRVALPSAPAGRYSNPLIQRLYDKLYSKGIRSKRDALEVGCMVEVTDVEDLNRYIYSAQRAGADDVASTYDFLRRGSYNHYWAFDRGLKSLGVSQGCCSLGAKYCHLEYPQKERGGGRGRGHGMGLGRGF